jgi:hypothetical protein
MNDDDLAQGCVVCSTSLSVLVSLGSDSPFVELKSVCADRARRTQDSAAAVMAVQRLVLFSVVVMMVTMISLLLNLRGSRYTYKGEHRWPRTPHLPWPRYN